MKIMLFNDYRIGIIKGEGVVGITSVVSRVKKDLKRTWSKELDWSGSNAV